MVKTIYFIRHAEPDYAEKDDYKRALTSSGKLQAEALVSLFSQVTIGAVYSSPYLRSIETVQPLARSRGLDIKSNVLFRERKSAGYIVAESEFQGYAQRQWSDFNYKYVGGESLNEVAERYKNGVLGVLSEMQDNGIDCVVIGCHITALCAYLATAKVINNYDEFKKYRFRNPWIVRATYDGYSLMEASINTF